MVSQLESQPPLLHALIVSRRARCSLHVYSGSGVTYDIVSSHSQSHIRHPDIRSIRAVSGPCAEVRHPADPHPDEIWRGTVVKLVSVGIPRRRASRTRHGGTRLTVTRAPLWRCNPTSETLTLNQASPLSLARQPGTFDSRFLLLLDDDVDEPHTPEAEQCSPQARDRLFAQAAAGATSTAT